MKKGKKKEITALLKPRALEQIPIDFSYLNYLCVSESTVLAYLQLRRPEEVEAEPEESAIAFA